MLARHNYPFELATDDDRKLIASAPTQGAPRFAGEVALREFQRQGENPKPSGTRLAEPFAPDEIRTTRMMAAMVKPNM